MKVLVVGAGFAGCVMAERLATEGHKVLLVDRREHIGGNAYDETDDHGILIHRYGAHIFHTNAMHVVGYLSRFTAWRPYRHRVLSRVDKKLVPVPINRTTVNALFELNLKTDAEVHQFYSERVEKFDKIENSEQAVVSKVGRELYEMMFKGYTRKQWERDPSELDRSVCSRIPIRTNDDPYYFGDLHQAMPEDGYTAMFEEMVMHPGITVVLGVAAQNFDLNTFGHVVWTGPIDEFFGHCYGHLPYRSLKFELNNFLGPDLLQQVAVINHPGLDVPYTRSIEYRHMTGQQAESTSIHLEFPSQDGEPFYPVPTPDSKRLLKLYQGLARQLTHRVKFVGRLARYQYLDMDQVTAQALKAAAEYE